MLVAVVVGVVEEGAQLHRFCLHVLVCLRRLIAQLHHLIVWQAEGSALKCLLELFVVPLRYWRELRFAKPVPPHLNACDLRELLGLETDLLSLSDHIIEDRLVCVIEMVFVIVEAFDAAHNKEAFLGFSWVAPHELTVDAEG